MSKFVAMTAIALALSASGAVAAEQSTSQSSQQRTQVQSQTTIERQAVPVQTQQSDSALKPVAASGIVGQDLESSDGEDLGKIQYVLADNSGAFQFALIDPEDDVLAGSELVVVPWSQIDLSEDKIGMTKARFVGAPKGDPGEIGELLASAEGNQIYSYYGMSAPQRSESQRYVVLSDQGLLPTLGGSQVTRLQTAGGQSYGDVQRVMVDPSTGRISSIIVQRESDQRVQVPFDRLTWSEQGTIINMSDSELAEIPAFEDDTGPDAIER